jgi:hypothetical protein
MPERPIPTPSIGGYALSFLTIEMTARWAPTFKELESCSRRRSRTHLDLIQSGVAADVPRPQTAAALVESAAKCCGRRQRR